MNRRSARWSGRSFLLATLVLGAACAATEPEDPVEAGLPPGMRKIRLLMATDMVIHQIQRDARRDIDRVKEEAISFMASQRRGVRLASPDPELEAYGAAERKARRDEIERTEHLTKAKLENILTHYEEALWAVAVDAGKRERGSALGFRSGYRELDEKVDAALLQLGRNANIDGVAQAATLSIYDQVELDRVIRHELPGLGVLSFYKSQPVLGLFASGQEGQSAAVIFQYEREQRDSKLPLHLVQAVRRVVERGGLIVAETPWRFDAPAGSSGRVELNPELEGSSYFGSHVSTPVVDTGSQEFSELFDHVLISEYRTALRRNDTGEILVTFGWQVRWNVDFRGTMRVLVDRNDLVLVKDPVLPALLGRAPAPQS